MPRSFALPLRHLLLVVLALGLAAARLHAAVPAPSVEVSLPDADPLHFIWIAPGSFMRGSPADEPGRDGDEGPANTVTLTRGFYLGQFEVTQGQWLAVMGENPAAFDQTAEALRRPVESVSWNDAQAFIARLNAQGRGTFRLPTEAEWEYAARAGTTTRYHWGNDTFAALHAHAWANSRSFATTHPVGTKRANPWGLHDMSGNVWEWCADWYAPYPAEAQTDPVGPAEGREKVFRGGSWYDFADAQRSANRHRHVPDRGYTAVGLRLVYSPPASGTAAAAPPPLPAGPHVSTLSLPHGASMQFLRIPAGRFSMGSPDDETGRARDEGPVRTVTISRDFHLGRFEVTQAQWRALMGENPSAFRDDPRADRLPVEQVTMHAVRQFLERLNGLGLGHFRLPTEAEWEYAARAGSSARFPWGDDPDYRGLRRQGWFHGAAEGRSQPVGTREPNPWGLHDMFGNVWEWCADWYGEYDAAATVDPTGPERGDARVIRGGSWFNEPEALRPANRHRHAEEARLTNLGLRLVWSGPEADATDRASAADPAAPHPRLFLAAIPRDRLRALPAASPHHAAVWQALLARVHAGAAAYHGRPGYRHSALAREAAFAYQVTGDTRYSELAFAVLRDSRAADEDQPDRNYSLSRAMMSMGYALAYDWCHEAWDDAQRAEVLGVMQAAADAWPSYRHGNLEAPHRGSNWVGVSRSGELLLHLAARHDDRYGDRADRIAVLLDDLSRHVDTAYGPSGWSQEGLGYLEYTFGFLAPAAYAARDAGYPGLWDKLNDIAWPRLALMSRSFRPGQLMLQSGVSNAGSTNEGFVSLLWPLVKPSDRAAYRWFYDRHAGALATPSFADQRRAAAIWSLLYYPSHDVGSTEPEVGALMDAEKGAYYFRNRWQDGDDVLISLMTRNDHHSHGWSQGETWQLGLMAFGTTFAAGPGKERDPALYSKILIDGAPERLTPASVGRELQREIDAQGGGTVIHDASANFGLDRAVRRFAVDFSGRRGVPAIIDIEDELANDAPFTASFQLRPEAGVTAESLPARPGEDHGGFVLRHGEAWLRGWVLSPAGSEILPGPTLRVIAPRSSQTSFRLRLAIGQGTPPETLP